MRALREWWPFIALGALFTAIYLFTAIRQSNELNLSVTAGGQYPYFQNAKRMTVQGISHYMGDRNRMPLMPALLSSLHSGDRQAFFQRGKMLAINTSFVLTLALAVVFFATLPRWPAVFMAGLAGIHVFLPKSSFVQAELAYYALFFLSWLLLCAVLKTCELKWAILAGVAAAFAYYSKASATPLLVLFVTVMIIRLIYGPKIVHTTPPLPSGLGLAVAREGRGLAVLPLPLGEGRGEGYGGATDRRVAPVPIWRSLCCALIPPALFLLFACPYLLDNKERFGRYFYNVNSTFFMWMDNWAEAQQFAVRYDINERFPEADVDQIPSFAQCLRTHTGAQIWKRMVYGVSNLACLAIDAPYFKYFAIAVCGLVILCLRYPRMTINTFRECGFPLLFTVVTLVAYGLAYCWYAVVSYGDRFILSLYLPVVFSLTWICIRLSGSVRLSVRGRSFPVIDIVAVGLVLLLLVEGAAMATVKLPYPNEHFVEFYFNESREAFVAGDVEAAMEGYHGSIQLEPTFAPAHHELAIVALQSGRPRDALDSARAAVELEPHNANYLNTYGSALLQMGDVPKAVNVLEQAVLADPRFASAWYNLGIAYTTAGQMEDARRVVEELMRIDPQAANRLRGLIERP